MKQSIWTVGQPSNPQAFITKRKQRIKQFEGQVYLNDGDEYEIEIFNPGAIDNNGYVEVEFYSEWKQQQSYWGGGANTITLSGNSTYTTGTPYLSATTFTTSGTSTSTFYNTSLTSNTIAGPNIRNVSNKIETGTTEKGDVSNQQFTQSNKDFYSYSFYNVAWRILPTSTKQYHKEDLGVLYCGECGAKRKKDTHKFCPHCGTKF